ncbi:DUF6273 domain-containing protein [Eubacterium sp.]|uniref:DUF6273 domain-containing protein n=1 Tax=Eubacterium sp. TaxID=142586 RepID=UPI003F06A615
MDNRNNVDDIFRKLDNANKTAYEDEQKNKAKQILADKKQEKQEKIINSIIGIVIAVVVLITVCSFGIKSMNNSKLYNEAMTNLNNGNTVEAYEQFFSLGGYKDSKERYLKIKEAHKGDLKYSAIGDTIEFGKIEVKEDFSDTTTKPMSWIIIAKDGNKFLLLSEEVIDDKIYNWSLEKEKEPCTWETSFYREYLNDEFYNKAFSKKEKKQILTSNVINTPENDYGISGGNDTKDKLFFLSKDEAEQYLTKKERKASNHLWWYLRTQSTMQGQFIKVDKRGKIEERIKRKYIYNSQHFRPAMWITVD